MKKIAIILAAAAFAVIAMPSCKNNKKTAEEAEDYSQTTAQELNTEALKVDMANLVASAKRIKAVPFLKSSQDGKIQLTDKEKMVKPDYLISKSVIEGLVGLNQKYRAVGILTSDKSIADLYEMPTADYNEAIVKLLTDINDSALTDFYTLPPLDIETNTEAFGIFVDEEKEAGRLNFFWEGVSAGLVEQVFLLTRDIDRYMPMFTDELANDITFNFVCVHDGLTKTVDATPEMASLNEILEPLYVINAATVDQLKEQLTSLKDQIATAREDLLK